MGDAAKCGAEDAGLGATSASAPNLMRIGELAERLDVSARTIRYYEGLGLIKPARRKGKGYRYFDNQALERMIRIQELKRLGLSLDEIVDSLQRQFSGKDSKKAHKKAIKALETQLDATEAQMEALRDFRRRLKADIAYHKGALRSAKR
jgi:DNA-binding transcriptional MerR regulator